MDSVLENTAERVRRRSPFLLLLTIFLIGRAAAAEQPVFGPTTYEVKERYGRDNRYQETVNAPAGNYLIKLQNGQQPAQGSDLIEFSVNAAVLLKDRHYEHRFLACYVPLKPTNSFELAIKDFDPPAFKRPPLVRKNVVVTVVPEKSRLANVVFGVHVWDDAKDYAASLLKIASPESYAFAVGAAGLQHDSEYRADAMRKLSVRRDPSARDFILHRFLDTAEAPEVRGEAALALGLYGEKDAIPTLLQGLLDPDSNVRLGSARALSLFREEDTKELLLKTLGQMHGTMRTGVVHAIAGVGWRPVGTLLALANSPDPDTANVGIELLTGSNDQRTVDAMLSYLQDPGERDLRLIIAVLAASKDDRAKAALSRLAADAEKGRGLEAEIGSALAAFGDKASAELIVVMIKRLDPRYAAYHKLRAAYKKLTGIEYQPAPVPGPVK